MILDDLTKSRVHRQGTTSFYQKTAERVIAAMRMRLSEPLEISALAKVAIISPYHFIRIFREITGIPPCRFLAALRIERAKELLLSTDLSVTDICFQVGYTSQGTFTRIFSEFVGLSPNQLRRFATSDNVRIWNKRERWSELGLGRASKRAKVVGRISGPAHFSGNIFVGLFRTRIPQGQPVAGALVKDLGTYKIHDVPDGLYYSLAAAFPDSQKPLDYLLPRPSSMLVAQGWGPIRVVDGQVSGPTVLALRSVEPIDPPILIALPSLLTEYVKGVS